MEAIEFYLDKYHMKIGQFLRMIIALLLVLQNQQHHNDNALTKSLSDAVYRFADPVI